MKELWIKAFVKAKGSAIILQRFEGVQTKI
jgi:hypothetical protein